MCIFRKLVDASSPPNTCKAVFSVIESVYAYGIWRGYAITVSWISCNISDDVSFIALVRRSENQIELSIVNTVHIVNYGENRKKLERSIRRSSCMHYH